MKFYKKIYFPVFNWIDSISCPAFFSLQNNFRSHGKKLKKTLVHCGAEP